MRSFNRIYITGGGDRKPYSKAWWRHPVDRSIELSSDELLGHNTVVLEKPVLKEAGQNCPVASCGEPTPRTIDQIQSVEVDYVYSDKSPAEWKEGHPTIPIVFFSAPFQSLRPTAKRASGAIPSSHTTGTTLTSGPFSSCICIVVPFAVGHGCAADWQDSNGECATPYPHGGHCRPTR